MRKLATIASIDDVQPIEGADRIERVKIRGWWCVSRKGEFKIGDKAIYFETDSFLPVIPEFEFMAKGTSPKKMIADGEEIEGYRLKTVFLRKQISQGLALPVSVFPAVADKSVGDDVTDDLGVLLYEPPMDVSLSGEAVGALPGFCIKTDEERIQNLTPWLEERRRELFVVTVKVDGTSTTVFKTEERFGVCGHSWEWKDTGKNTYWNVAKRYNLQEKMPVGYAVQAEMVGERIQSNRMLLKGQDFYVFYVWNIAKGEYLQWDDMEHFTKELGLKTVPLFDRHFVLDHTLEQLLALADGPCPLNPKVLREGLVFRLDAPGTKVSFKAISNQYLAHYGL